MLSDTVLPQRLLQYIKAPSETKLNSLRPRQNRRHFADDIFKCIFLNENEWISLRISLKFGPNGRINNFPSLVQIMVWRRPGDKPLSEPMMVSLLTHICITRPQWVKLKSAEISVAHNVHFSCRSVLKLYTENISITVVLCTSHWETTLWSTCRRILSGLRTYKTFVTISSSWPAIHTELPFLAAKTPRPPWHKLLIYQS